MTFLDLDEVKNHLGKSTVVDDVELAGFIAAAEGVIVDLKGPVESTAVVEVADMRRGYPRDVLVLETTPVLEVTEVLLLPASVLAAGDREAGVDGWVLDPADLGAGLLRHTSRFPYGRLQIAYLAGVDPVPGNYVLAGKELVAHLWRGSQTAKSGGGGSRFGMGSDDGAVYVGGVGYALPNRVCQLLGLDPKAPRAASPLVG